MALVALLDANVLYPAYLRDTLLRLAQAEIYQIRWSRDILDEMAHSVIRNRPDLHEESINRLVRFMEEAFPEAMVEGYEPLIPAMANDPKDRHVLAAAIRGRADAIVTSNVRDFPPAAYEPYDVEVQTPDDFLCHQWEVVDSNLVLEILEDWASQLNSPSLTTEELLERLSRVVPNFSAQVLEAKREKTSER